MSGGTGPHGAGSDGGSSRTAEASCRRRSEATSSRWFRRCSRRLARVDEPDVPRRTGTDLDALQIRRIPVLNGLVNEYMHAA